MKRRDFLRGSGLGIAALLGSRLALTMALAQDDDEEDTSPGLELTGAITNVHDPVMIKQDNIYYVFCTGAGIPMRWSDDMLNWQTGGRVFQQPPEEAFTYVPQATNIWAPDISYFNDKYHIYYSVSTFGSNRSAIGLVTNTTLHPDDPDFEWVDQGIVTVSTFADNHNAIDANLILDTEGTPWLAFGSHWGGLKMIRLDYETGKQSAEDETLYSLAARAIHPRAVEAPFIIYRDDTYYLFVSYDQCCRGSESNYNVRVGRSESVTGPYVDRDGVPMMEDGGTQITFPTERWRGPGHNAIFSEDGQDYIVYHAYDAARGGTPTLRITPLQWEEDGFPTVTGMSAEA